MTTVAAKRLVQGTALTGSAVTQYTSGTSTKTVIKAANAVNTTGGAVTLTVYLVPSGGAAAAENTVISAYSIAAGASYQCPEMINQVLEAGDFISAFASASASINFTVSGITIV